MSLTMRTSRREWLSIREAQSRNTQTNPGDGQQNLRCFLQLEAYSFEGDVLEQPSDAELAGWAQLGLLPPGRGGREKTARKVKDWRLPNVCRDTSLMETQVKEGIKHWTPNYDWIPRPLVEDQLFFLIFFSGHRRWGDIASWLHGDGRVVPIAVDLAVCPTHGNVLHSSLWERLIMARRVVGAHGGPPCETYSVARWREVPGKACPRPLRDQDFPWGRLFLQLFELIQCHTGTQLMMVTLKLLLLVYAHNGSISLEHPRGDMDSQERWCIWMSGFIQWMLLAHDVNTVTFLQGPLGQCAPKPTTFLVGRMQTFANKVYSSYDKRWRPTSFLVGRDSEGWMTARAKVYPPLLSKLIAECHLEHATSVDREGHSDIPSDIKTSIEALSKIFDPYLHWSCMQSDYHRGRNGQIQSTKIFEPV